jgi:hypothetical protein
MPGVSLETPGNRGGSRQPGPNQTGGWDRVDGPGWRRGKEVLPKTTLKTSAEPF